jgi:hypothetical protein
VIRRSPTLRAKALPSSYRALAASLTAARITVSHDQTAQAALAAAGVQAATIGRTILLDHAPTTSFRDREVVAHELVHAAANTRTPRFFDDPHQDHEERTAASVGRLVRTMGSDLVRTPAVPAISLAPGALAHKADAASPMQRVANAAAPALPGGAASAGMLLRTPTADPKPTIRRTAGGRSMTTLQRSPMQGSGPSSSTNRGATSRMIQRCGTGGGDDDMGGGDEGGGGGKAVVVANPATSSQPDHAKMASPFDRSGRTPPSATERLDQIDELVALIEARVLAELERRGGQHRGWI